MTAPLYHLQPTLHNSTRNSFDSDSPSIYSQSSPDQAQPQSTYEGDGAADVERVEDAYSRSPSPGAGSFLTRGGTFSTVRGHSYTDGQQEQRPTHFVRQLDTPPASPPLSGSAKRGSGGSPAAGDEAGAGSDDGLPGYRKPTVRGRSRGKPGPGVGTMIRRRGGAGGGFGWGGGGSLSEGSEDGETEAQRVAREAAEAMLARDEMMEKRRVAAERAAASEEERVVDEQASQAQLVKGIETMLADQMGAGSAARQPGGATAPNSPRPAIVTPQSSAGSPPTRFQLHDAPLPIPSQAYTSTPPGWTRAQPDFDPAPVPLLRPTPRSFNPHDDLEYLNAPALGPPVPAYEPPEDPQLRPQSCEHEHDHAYPREPTPLPAFVPSDGPAATAAARHPKEAFFSEARRQDFRVVNGLDGGEMGRSSEVTPRGDEDGLERRTTLWPSGEQPGGGYSQAGLLAPPPPFEGAYGHGQVHLSQGLQERGYQPEWRPPPPPDLSESPADYFSVDPGHGRGQEGPTYRGSYHPPPRVFTPVEIQQRPASAQVGRVGMEGSGHRNEWRGVELGSEYYRQGGGRSQGPPVSMSGGAAGYYGGSGGRGVSRCPARTMTLRLLTTRCGVLRSPTRSTSTRRTGPIRSHLADVRCRSERPGCLTRASLSTAARHREGTCTSPTRPPPTRAAPPAFPPTSQRPTASLRRRRCPTASRPAPPPRTATPPTPRTSPPAPPPPACPPSSRCRTRSARRPRASRSPTPSTRRGRTASSCGGRPSRRRRGGGWRRRARG